MIVTALLSKFIKGTFKINSRCLQGPHLRNFHFNRVVVQRCNRPKHNVSVNCLAYIHCSMIIKAKRFPHLENHTIHSAMENNPDYRDVVKRPTIEAFKSVVGCWNSPAQQPSDVFQRFTAITLENQAKDKLNLEDNRFHDLLLLVAQHIPIATDDQLRAVLMSLCVWPSSSTSRDPMFKLLWNSLDNECAKRLKDWAPGYKLLIADYWFHLSLSRISVYNSQMISDLVRNRDILSTPQLVQLMFYVNLQRNTPQQLLKSLEDRLEHLIRDINIEELCIVCLGFFKTKNRITSKHIVKSILVRLISEVSKADSFAISGCFKFLRKSMHGDLKDLYISLLYQAVKHVSKCDIPASIHVCLLSSEMNLYMPLLLDTVMDKLVEEQSVMRAKDGMKLLHCLAQFNHQPKPDFDKLLQETFVSEKYEEEMTSYPRILFYSLLSYAYLGHYPVTLIRKALDPGFVESAIEAHGVEFMNPIATLDYCIEIECESYDGPRVNESILKMLRTEKGNVPREKGHQSFQARLLSLTFQVLSDIRGSSKDICIKHIMPHMFSPDIILRLNSKDEVPLSSVLEASGDDIIKPPSHELWVCVMVCGGYCFPYQSKRLNGINSMKLRQLLKLGYKVLQVPYYEAESVSQLRKYIAKNLELLQKNNNDLSHQGSVFCRHKN